MVATARLLGVPAFEHRGRRFEPAPGKTSALLCYLAHRDGWVGRDEVLALLWPEHDEAKARSSFRQMLTAVRRLPFTDDLEIERTRLRWPLPTDVEAFRTALDRGRSDEATEIYRGVFLEGFSGRGIDEFESWVQLERTLLQDLWREAVLASAERLEAAAEYRDALRLLERLRRAEPFDEEALRAQIRCLARAGRLGRALEVFAHFERLVRDELASEPAPATRGLVERLRSGAQSPPPTVAAFGAAVSRGAGVRLPAATTPFLGRERELSELAELLADPERRLVTVVGPGGIGKTRLALEAARTLADRYRDGAAFVPLVSIDRAELVPAAIASALGLVFGSEDVFASLIRALRDRRSLFVLDNLEQFDRLDLLAELLEAAPGLQLLATSRRRLDLHCEWLYGLTGLEYPAEHDEKGDLDRYDAVRLFVQAARRMRSGLSFDPEDLRAAARIGRAVAGMPLALELAAGWLRTFTVAELADEIERGLDLFSTAERDMPLRHRSIRATFDRSWELLPPEARRVLPHFALFRGGMDRAAAVAVTGSSLVTLTGLIDRSLLAVVAGGRFDLHPLMAQYLRGRLEESGELPVVQERHGKHYLALLDTIYRNLWGRTREALTGWSLERENIRAAWMWAIQNGRSERVGTAALPLTTLYRLEARAAEGIELLELASERFRANAPELEGMLLICRADLATLLGRYDRVQELAQRGLELLRGRTPTAVQVIGEILVRTFGATEHLAQTRDIEPALELAERLDEPLRSTLMAKALHQHALEADDRGERERSARLDRRRHDLYQGVAYGPGIVWTTFGLGFDALYRGAYREAEHYAVRGAELAHEFGYERASQTQWMVRSRAAFGLGRLADAKAYALTCLEALEQTDFLTDRAVMLASAGRACAHLGEFHEAERLLRDALALGLELSRLPTLLLEPIVYLAELRAEQSRFERAATLAGLALSRPDTRAWNRAQAEALLAKLAQRLDHAALEAARSEGKRLELEPLVEELLVTLAAGTPG